MINLLYKLIKKSSFSTKQAFIKNLIVRINEIFIDK